MELRSNSDRPLSSQQWDTPSEVERWGALIIGGTLVLTGLGQRSLRGVLLAIAGGSLAYYGVTAQKSLPDIVMEVMGIDNEIRIEKTVTIQNKSPEELYHFWRNFSNLPRFMKHLKSVTVINDQRSHWIASAPLGASVEWDADIINDQENQLISWTSVGRGEVNNSGFVRFKPLGHERGTEVKVVMDYNLPGGGLTNALAKMFGEAPEQQVGDDLRRFKMLMETGEIATTEGQSRGNG